MLFALMTLAIFALPTIVGAVTQYLRFARRRSASLFFDGLLLSVCGVILPIAAGAGIGLPLIDLMFAAIIIGTMWPLFFLLGFKLSKPFLEIWNENWPINPETAIKDHF